MKPKWIATIRLFLKQGDIMKYLVFLAFITEIMVLTFFFKISEYCTRECINMNQSSQARVVFVINLHAP